MWPRVFTACVLADFSPTCVKFSWNTKVFLRNSPCMAENPLKSRQLNSSPHYLKLYSHTNRKTRQDWGNCFVTGKAEDAEGLAPFKDDNAVRRKTGHQDVVVFCWFDYKCITAPPCYIWVLIWNCKISRQNRRARACLLPNFNQAVYVIGYCEYRSADEQAPAARDKPLPYTRGCNCALKSINYAITRRHRNPLCVFVTIMGLEPKLF